MNEGPSNVASDHSFFAEEQNKPEKKQNKSQYDFSKNSSNPEGIFDMLNKEIKHVVENCKDLSYYSNSNSKISEQQQYNEQFLDSRYWCVGKNHDNENDFLSIKNDKKDNMKIKNNKNEVNNNYYGKVIEEKILYVNDEDENNDFNDDFDEKDMEEKTIENMEKGINEINSIKVNKNNLNNKGNLNNNNSKFNYNNEVNTVNKSKSFIESDEHFLILKEQIKCNKINQSYFPYIHKNQQVRSFVSTYNNYPSTFSKGSFISTNNSSNNKYKKEEEHFSFEEEIKINNNMNNINNNEIRNNNSYRHGNKFGPHLSNYNQLSNNNINAESTNMNNINNNSNFNMNNNFLYNRIPKMNLNMVYYIPVQQSIPNNINYINNNKVFSNLNIIKNKLVI